MEFRDNANDDFNKVVHMYHKPIFRYCFNMLRNYQEAEDAAQEVFLKAYKSFLKHDNIQSISAWIYKIAYNHCLNVIRRKNLLSFITLENIYSSRIGLPEESMYSNEFSLEVQEILLKLSPMQRTILILKTVEEMKYDEISDVLGIKPETARKQYERAKTKIKKLVSIEGEDENGEKNTVISRL